MLFWLINVLFFDNFARDFALLANIPYMYILDTGKATNDEHIWMRVCAVFVQADENYSNMWFLDDDIFTQQP